MFEEEERIRRRCRRRSGVAAAAAAAAGAALLLGASPCPTAQAFAVPSSTRLLPSSSSPAAAAAVAAAAIARGRPARLSPLFMASKLDQKEPQQAAGFDPLALEAASKPAGALSAAKAVEGGGPDGGNNLVYKGMLLMVAILWGSNFGALKYLDTCGVEVSLLTAFRFLLASVALLPSLWGKGTGILKAGLEVGLWVALGYMTQAIGLETTEASKSAFICSLTVVTVPLINGLFFGKKISPPTWAACALAVIGVGLLTLQGASGPVIGDLWSLGQPLGFGIAFMRIEHHMQTYKGLAVPLAAAQMLSVFLVSALWAAISTGGFQHVGDLSVLADPAHAASLLYTGLITSAFAVVLESVALAFVPAEETAVIFSTEPLFAAATSAVFLGERLKPTGMLGGLAILAACLVTQMDVAQFMTFLPLAAKVADEGNQEGL